MNYATVLTSPFPFPHPANLARIYCHGVLFLLPMDDQSSFLSSLLVLPEPHSCGSPQQFFYFPVACEIFLKELAMCLSKRENPEHMTWCIRPWLSVTHLERHHCPSPFLFPILTPSSAEALQRLTLLTEPLTPMRASLVQLTLRAVQREPPPPQERVLGPHDPHGYPVFMQHSPCQSLEIYAYLSPCH